MLQQYFPVKANCLRNTEVLRHQTFKISLRLTKLLENEFSSYKFATSIEESHLPTYGIAFNKK